MEATAPRPDNGSPRQQLKPRQRTDYNNQIHGRMDPDDDDIPVSRPAERTITTDSGARGYEVTGTFQGRPMVKFTGEVDVEAEIERHAENVRIAEDEMAAVWRRNREEQNNSKEEAEVEEAQRIKKSGSFDEQWRHCVKDQKRLKLLDSPRISGCESEPADELESEGHLDNGRVVFEHAVSALNANAEDEWYYEGFTAHPFYQEVHPPRAGAERGKYPPKDKYTFAMPRWVGRVAPTLSDRMILALLVYYFQVSARDGKVRARRRLNDHLWVAKTDEEMGAELMIPAKTVKAARHRLQKRHLIVVEHHRFPSMQRDGTSYMLRMCHYRINWSALEQAYYANRGDYNYLHDAHAQRSVSEALEKIIKRNQNELNAGLRAVPSPQAK